VFELDVDQATTGADALQLQVTVAANNVAEIAPQRRLPLHGRHADGLFPDDDPGALTGDDHIAHRIPAHCDAALPGGHTASARHCTRAALRHAHTVLQALPQRGERCRVVQPQGALLGF
jgi:hypothetical protein